MRRTAIHIRMIEQTVRKALARLMNFWYLEDLLPHVPKLSLLAPRARAMIFLKILRHCQSFAETEIVVTGWYGMAGRTEGARARQCRNLQNLLQPAATCCSLS